MGASVDLIVDNDRLEFTKSGILVRAKCDDKWGPHDITHLTKESLLLWLRSDGKKNPLAENVIGIIFGHGYLTTNED